MTNFGCTELWIQDKVKEKEIDFIKIARERNSADALTKHWGPDGLKHFASSSFVMPCFGEEGSQAGGAAAAAEAANAELRQSLRLRGGVHVLPLLPSVAAR